MEGPSKRPRVPQIAPAGGFGLGMAVESGPQVVDEEDEDEVEEAVVDADVGEDVMVAEVEGVVVAELEEDGMAEEEGEEYALPL